MEMVYGIDDINEAAGKVWSAIGQSRVITFTGNMGAGKTTFIHALCRRLGVTGTVSSPTFSIINEYGSDHGPVYHIDLYRCAHPEEAVRAGVEDCLYSGNICLVEWPSRAEGIFPEDTVVIDLNEIDPQTRRITFNTRNN